MKTPVVAVCFFVSLVSVFNCYGQNFSEFIVDEWRVDSIYTHEKSFGADSLSHYLDGRDLIIIVKTVDALKCNRSEDSIRFVMSFGIVNRCGWPFDLKGLEVVFCDYQCTAKYCAKDKDGRSPCKSQTFEETFIPILGEMNEIQQESDSLRLLSASGAKIFLTPIEY